MPKRSYHQYCALAKALDVLGERWTLLIVRNLLLGGMRYTDLMQTLPGITTNMLADRLKAMSARGLIDKIEERYQLTSAGRELEPAVRALANWGEKHVLGAPGEGDRFDLRWLMTSVWRHGRPTAESCIGVIRVGERAFTVKCGSEYSVRERDMAVSDVELIAPMAALADIFFRKLPIKDVEGAELHEHRAGAARVFTEALGISA
jgi:DNA-binding HxlR family transcriptional regulator